MLLYKRQPSHSFFLPDGDGKTKKILSRSFGCQNATSDISHSRPNCRLTCSECGGFSCLVVRIVYVPKKLLKYLVFIHSRLFFCSNACFVSVPFILSMTQPGFYTRLVYVIEYFNCHCLSVCLFRNLTLLLSLSRSKILCFSFFCREMMANFQ